MLSGEYPQGPWIASKSGSRVYQWENAGKETQLGHTLSREKKGTNTSPRVLRPKYSVPDSRLPEIRGIPVARPAEYRNLSRRCGSFTGRWERPHGRGRGGGAHRKLAEWRRLGDADRRASLDAIADIIAGTVRPQRKKPQSRNISSKVRSRISTIVQPDPLLNAMIGLAQQYVAHSECHQVSAALEAVHFPGSSLFRSFIVDHHIYLAMQTTSASRAHKVNGTDNLSHLRSCYWLGFESCPRYGRIRSAYSLVGSDLRDLNIAQLFAVFQFQLHSPNDPELVLYRETSAAFNEELVCRHILNLI